MITPIHLLPTTSKKLKKNIYIWRDDLTGFLESGNKIRKLEYLLEDAIRQGCDWIITCGGQQSNHCRATAVVARQRGLEVTLLLPKPDADSTLLKNPIGNFFLDKIFASHIEWIDQDTLDANEKDFSPFLKIEAEKLREQGRKPYIIPAGGSNALSCLGYQKAVPEMLEVWKKTSVRGAAPDSIFCALGTAGTFVGIQMGLHVAGKSDVPVYGVNVIDHGPRAKKFLSVLSAEVHAKHNLPIPLKNAHQVDGYIGGGYAIATEEELKFYVQFAREEGILLDPCYTGKAFLGMLAEIKKDPSRFGENILFVHTGGGFGIFGYPQMVNIMNELPTKIRN